MRLCFNQKIIFAASNQVFVTFHYILKNWVKPHHPLIPDLITYLDRSMAIFYLFFFGKDSSGLSILIKQNVGDYGWFKHNVDESGRKFSVWVKVLKCGCHFCTFTRTENWHSLAYLTPVQFADFKRIFLYSYLFIYGVSINTSILLQ